MPIIVEGYVMEGNPLRLEQVIIQELVNQLRGMSGSNYEDVCHNMRLMSMVIEEIEDHINDEYIKFEYNPTGAWIRVDKNKEVK